MKDEHLTLRLPRDLARALSRWARERGIPKSQVVREAVAQYFTPNAAEPVASPVTGAMLAGKWAALPRLTSTEAGEFAADLDAARQGLPGARSPWE
jgi:hypothetical protein